MRIVVVTNNQCDVLSLYREIRSMSNEPSLVVAYRLPIGRNLCWREPVDVCT